MIREKLKQEREELAKFVCNSVPKLQETIGLGAVISNVHVVFEHSAKPFLKDQWLLQEGEMSDKISIIQSGRCGLYKNVQQVDQIG